MARSRELDWGDKLPGEDGREQSTDSSESPLLTQHQSG